MFSSLNALKLSGLMCLSIIALPSLALAATNSGIDTATGNATLPFSIEGNPVMDLSNDGLSFETGKKVTVDTVDSTTANATTANVGTLNVSGEAYVAGQKVIKVSDIPTCTSTQNLQFNGTSFSCISSPTANCELRRSTVTTHGTRCNSCPNGTIQTDCSSDVYLVWVTTCLSVSCN